MKKMILLIAALCCAALFCDAMAQAPSNPTSLKQDSGVNLSKMNLSMYTSIQDFGLGAFSVGEAVKFTAPKPGWKLMGVEIFGWSGLNQSSKSLPAPENFLLEIRDKDLNVLYRMADSQNAYFTYPNPVLRQIDVPAIPIAGDFYVIFYDRGSMALGRENLNATGNSYFFDNYAYTLAAAEFTKTKTNETAGINWLIRAVGE